MAGTHEMHKEAG